jgi:Golgi nucleoside diphosphatase
MRLMDDDVLSFTLEAIRNYIKTHYRGFLYKDDWVRVLDSDEEGVFDWFSVQQIITLSSKYRADWIKPFEVIDNNPNLAASMLLFNANYQVFPGILDMGGASMEISFPISSHSPEDAVDVQSKSSVSVSYYHKKLEILSLGYDQYGHTRAHRAYQNHLIQKNLDSNDTSFRYYDPCVLRGAEIYASVGGPTGEKVTLYGSVFLNFQSFCWF